MTELRVEGFGYTTYVALIMNKQIIKFGVLTKSIKCNLVAQQKIPQLESKQVIQLKLK